MHYRSVCNALVNSLYIFSLLMGISRYHETEAFTAIVRTISINLASIKDRINLLVGALRFDAGHETTRVYCIRASLRGGNFVFHSLH